MSISVGIMPSIVSDVSIDTAFDRPAGAAMYLDMSPW